MRSFEIEIMQAQLNDETKTLKDLKEIYRQALEEIGFRIAALKMDEQTPSKIYQLQYQKALKLQLERILNAMNEKQYLRIEEYLIDCYLGGYLGTMYSMQQQGVPLVMPINQKSVVKAVVLESKVSKGLYQALGILVDPTVFSPITFQSIFTRTKFRPYSIFKWASNGSIHFSFIHDMIPRSLQLPSLDRSIPHRLGFDFLCRRFQTFCGRTF